MDLNKVIKTIITDEDRTRALRYCFYTGDGEMNQEVIEQGILERYRAIGKPLEGILIQRTGLNTVEINHPTGNVCHIHRFPRLMSTDVYWTTDGIFTEEEANEMADWLLANFHH